jgi:hypothetical protein
VTWLAVLAATPTPGPKLSPGTTTPIQDALHWAELDFLITAGALLATLAQILGVYRTLVVVTRSQRHQRDVLAQLEQGTRQQAAILAKLAQLVEGIRGPDTPPE